MKYHNKITQPREEEETPANSRKPAELIYPLKLTFSIKTAKYAIQNTTEYAI